jgi:hypothetical protein
MCTHPKGTRIPRQWGKTRIGNQESPQVQTGDSGTSEAVAKAPPQEAEVAPIKVIACCTLSARAVVSKKQHSTRRVKRRLYQARMGFS